MQPLCGIPNDIKSIISAFLKLCELDTRPIDVRQVVPHENRD